MVLVLVEQIYAAVENPKRWRDVLSVCADVVGCQSAGLFARDLDRGIVSLAVSINFDDAGEPQKNMNAGEVRLTDQSATLCIANDDAMLASVTLVKNESGSFRDQDVRFLTAIAPHLQRALRVHQLCTNADATKRSLGYVIDRLAIGIVLMDNTGTVIYANAAAAAAFDLNDGLVINGGRIEAGSAHDTLLIRRLASDAAAVTHADVNRRGGAMRVRRPSGRQPFQLLVTAGPPSSGLVLSQSPAITIFISDPESADHLEPLVLQMLFGLTEAESGVASRLAAGSTVVQIANALHVSGSTVRTHLKSIFDKTETHRQSDLVKQLVGGVAKLNRSHRIGVKDPIARAVSRTVDHLAANRTAD
jgi:DNA-binding CsgD family transcriptional regulator/PAS domain-containing protein